eukprot:5754985-Pyramimonas_sp.AAC.2
MERRGREGLLELRLFREYASPRDSGGLRPEGQASQACQAFVERPSTLERVNLFVSGVRAHAFVFACAFTCVCVVRVRTLLSKSSYAELPKRANAGEKTGQTQ